MKFSTNILFFLLPLILIAEEEILETEHRSPRTILISMEEYSPEVKFDTKNDSFNESVVEDIQEVKSVEATPTIDRLTEEIQSTITSSISMVSEPESEIQKLSTDLSQSTLSVPILKPQEEVIQVENKASILTPISYEEAVARAKKENKMILLEVVSTDCKYCEKMEEEVFTQAKISEMLKKNFILLRMNGTTQTLPLGMGMVASPMHIFISKNEKIKDQYYGYKDGDIFLKILKKEI